MITQSGKQLIFLCLGFLLFAVPGHSEEGKTDVYAPLYAQPLAPQPLKDAFSRMIEAPFQLIKWPVDRAIMFTEEHRLDKKAQWLYEEGLKHGIKPHFGTIDMTSIPYYGLELSPLPLVGLKERYPDFIASATVLHCPSVFFEVGSEIGAQRIAETGFHAKGIFDYARMEKEPFYGIGPHTSMGDSTSYRIEETRLGLAAGYEFSPTLDLVSEFDYRRADIFSRAHDGKGAIDTIFAGESIPGIAGDDLLQYSLAFQRDTRDSKGDATRGGYQKLLFRFTEGLGGSAARYFTYRLDAAQYFRLGSPRRILAARLLGEHNDEINGGDIPFYNMAKLGGSGVGPRHSETARGFVYNRFYGESAVLLNLEYRYTVLEYKEYKLQTVFFVDEGQAFNEINDFRFKDLRESYGIGFYLSYSKNTLVNMSVAHSDEGTQFYIRNATAF